MNELAREISMHFGDAEYINDKESLEHYGMPKRSGRYPWGSGDQPYQHSGDFLSRVESLKKKGLSEDDIIRELNIHKTDYKYAMKFANHERRLNEIKRAESLAQDGLGATEIGKIMGKSESTIRGYLEGNKKIKENAAQKTAEILRKEIAEKGMVDVGKNVNKVLGVSSDTLTEALYILNSENGYEVHYNYKLSQPTQNRQYTTTNILKDSNKYPNFGDVASNIGDVKQVGKYYSEDGGLSFKEDRYTKPTSLSSKRIMVRYGEEGGLEKDGLIEIKRGVKELTLGNQHYAQVRILVDDTHYAKGMAVYSDPSNFPKGVDVIFNTNKSKGTPMIGSKDDTVLKNRKYEDENNPFGAYISAKGQTWYTNKNGEKALSPINKLKGEGDFNEQSKTLSSQFLSKQPQKLINSQLKATYDKYQDQYDEIMSLSNGTLKKKLLLDFAGSCDGAVNSLKAVALPRQRNQVLLPVPGMADTEIFAPNYKNGEKVALIRYPHGSTAEIPILTVNNNSKHALKMLNKNFQDCVGINSKVAERLSGADFDGDTVTVIPTHNGKVKIKNSDPLPGLKNFDPKLEYKIDPKDTKTPRMAKSNVQREMGSISNLLTDMQLRGANNKDIEKALKHSMVIIDAEKHGLDYKKSEKDNNIKELKQKWQKDFSIDGTGGASTLISRKKQDVRVPETRGSGVINPKTGKIEYKLSGRTYIDKKGNTVAAEKKVHLFDTYDDLTKLSTGTPQENAYANYGNKMKALANKARKESLTVKEAQYSKEAKLKYINEVNSLNNKLLKAELNAPRERHALAIANSKIKTTIQENPELKENNSDAKKQLKKIKQMAIEDARAEANASGKKVKINITDEEWKAIQSGAISKTKLGSILKYADSDRVKQLALPKSTAKLSPSKVSRIKDLSNKGYTQEEIAEQMSISVSTVLKYINE